MNNLYYTIKNEDVLWHQDLLTVLRRNQIDCKEKFEGDFMLLCINENHLILNLININNPHNPEALLELQAHFQEQNIKFIQLWEDVWLTKPAQVLARIKSLLGLNKRIHGRKTKIQKIAKPIADSFLQDNHLQGSVSSRYKLGLFVQDDLVAVATFSALRQMKHTENYKSAELIRFAVKSGCSVTGGLSKLISKFQELLSPNDIMTYADRDWSAGEAYIRLGFTQTDIIEPQRFILDENLNRQLKKTAVPLVQQQEVFNTGSLKYLLKF